MKAQHRAAIMLLIAALAVSPFSAGASLTRTAAAGAPLSGSVTIDDSGSYSNNSQAADDSSHMTCKETIDVHQDGSATETIDYSYHDVEEQSNNGYETKRTVDIAGSGTVQYNPQLNITIDPDGSYYLRFGTADPGITLKETVTFEQTGGPTRTIHTTATVDCQYNPNLLQGKLSGGPVLKIDVTKDGYWNTDEDHNDYGPCTIIVNVDDPSLGGSGPSQGHGHGQQPRPTPQTNPQPHPHPCCQPKPQPDPQPKPQPDPQPKPQPDPQPKPQPQPSQGCSCKSCSKQDAQGAGAKGSVSRPALAAPGVSALSGTRATHLGDTRVAQGDFLCQWFGTLNTTTSWPPNLEPNKIYLDSGLCASKLTFSPPDQVGGWQQYDDKQYTRETNGTYTLREYSSRGWQKVGPVQGRLTYAGGQLRWDIHPISIMVQTSHYALVNGTLVSLDAQEPGWQDSGSIKCTPRFLHLRFFQPRYPKRTIAVDDSAPDSGHPPALTIIDYNLYQR